MYMNVHTSCTCKHMFSTFPHKSSHYKIHLSLYINIQQYERKINKFQKRTDDVSKATSIVTNSRSDLLRGTPADKMGDGEAVLEELSVNLKKLAGAIDLKDPDKASGTSKFVQFVSNSSISSVSTKLCLFPTSTYYFLP